MYFFKFTIIIFLIFCIFHEASMFIFITIYPSFYNNIIIFLLILDFIKSHSNKPVYELVQSGLTYLDTRTEFWRQQRPLYARKKDNGKSSPKKKKATQSLGKQILKQLEDIDQGKFEFTLQALFCIIYNSLFAKCFNCISVFISS